MVLATHCTSDEKHLRSLYDDAGRDGRELLEAFKKYVEPEITESMALEIENAMERLRQSAKNKGIENIDGKYQSVSSIAALYPQLGDHFKIAYKMLSKFAHPTALTILGLQDAAVARFRLGFFTEGCLFFCGAIRPVAIRLGIELDDPLGQELQSILQ